jgi:limonene-1,2-epoxide hydrolase
MGEMYSSMRAELETVSAAGDTCVLTQTITFQVRDTGRTGVMPVVEVYRFRNGRIVDWRACYFDASMVADALTGRG